MNSIITGATKGIGRAISTAFAKEGINLAICSRNEKDLSDLKEHLQHINPHIQILAQVTDCSIKEQVKAFAQAAQQQLGFIDIIVNNVGLFLPSSILDEADGLFQTQINTNVLPAYELYRFFGKTMQAARKGYIFNICSVASIQPFINSGTYTVTKFALLGLNHVMREEMKAHQVKVTAILPGSTLTESWAGTSIPPEKFVLPEDVAAAVVNCLKMSAGANVDELIIRPTAGVV